MNLYEWKKTIARLQCEYDVADARWKEAKLNLYEARRNGAGEEELARLQGKAVNALGMLGAKFMALEWRLRND